MTVRKTTFANMQNYVRVRPREQQNSISQGSTRTAQTAFPVYRKRPKNRILPRLIISLGLTEGLEGDPDCCGPNLEGPSFENA
jgi:hypothetical protein